ncbi:energy transducer TonB, partial [Ectothiorhodospira sp. 9905]
EPEPEPEPETESAPQLSESEEDPPQDATVQGEESEHDAPFEEARDAPVAHQGGGDPAAEQDYARELRAWLERHKEYPRQAQRRRQEGVATVRVTIDRQGHVLSYELAQGSGYRLLDQAVEDMIRRADPLPAMPADVGESMFTFSLPVSFNLW